LRGHFETATGHELASRLLENVFGVEQRAVQIEYDGFELRAMGDCHEMWAFDTGENGLPDQPVCTTRWTLYYIVSIQIPP
jgi:hypothetical protein